MMLAYVLVQATPGKFNGALDNIKNLPFVLRASVVFGPVDILAKVRGENFDETVTSILKILGTEEVLKTTTSLVVDKEPEDLEKERESAYAYVFATATAKTGQDVLKAVRGRQVRSAKARNCHYILGEYDFVFEVQSDSLSDLKSLIQEIQTYVDGITGTTTMITSPP